MKQETQVPVAKYKDRFTRLLRQVEQGRTHTITKHGRAVARVVPAGPDRSVTDTIRSIRANRVRGKVDLKARLREGRM